MSYCAKCGTRVDEASDFCSECGTSTRKILNERNDERTLVSQREVERVGSTRQDSRMGLSENLVASTKKPLGIVLIAIYSAFSGITGLLGGAVMIFAAQVSAWFALLALASIIAGALGIACCYGLWTSQPWGIKTTTGLYLIMIPLGIGAMFADGSSGNVVLQLIGIAIAVWVVVYLAKQDRKAGPTPIST